MGTCTHCKWEEAWKPHGLCWKCESLSETAGDAFSTEWIRCPNCFSFLDGGRFVNALPKLDDGDHQVTCYCGHEFVVFLSIDFRFTSPQGSKGES